MGISVGSFAHDKDCCCKKKAAHHKTVQKNVIDSQKAAAPKPVVADELTYNTRVLEPCYRYRKHNIVVTECPGTFYDNSDLYNVATESSYMGNYPKQETTTPGPVAPQHITIDNYKGVAPAGGNGCNWNCTPE